MAAANQLTNHHFTGAQFSFLEGSVIVLEGCGELRQSGKIAKRAQLARGSYGGQGDQNVQRIANLWV